MKAHTKFYAAATVLLFSLGLVSCASRISSKIDFDRDVDLRQFRTYDWLLYWGTGASKTPVFFDTLNDATVKTAVDARMKEAGYVRSRAQPELLVVYYLILDDRVEVDPAGLGYEYAGYWIEKGTHLYKYREGTFILDIMDGRSRKLIWRGWAFTDLDQKHFTSEQLVKKSVEKIFNKFPQLRTDSF
jgi:hypothetical protein